MNPRQSNTCILETQFLPPVQYLTKFLVYEKVIIEAHEHYQKGSYRNRCHLLGPNGVQRVSVPLTRGKHEQLPIREVTIAYDQSWHTTLWHTIMTGYGSAPYFPYYAEALKDILYARTTHLFFLNQQLLDLLLDAFGLPHPLLTHEYQHQVDVDDLRDTVHPKRSQHDPVFVSTPYIQVFADRFDFQPNLSSLDLLLCLGPAGRNYLEASIK